MDKCKRKPYTQAELDQQAIWADEFDQWWESEGQYHRAGGDNYCRTFAWWAWLSREQSRQPEIDQLKHEKSLQELEINQVAQANQVWQGLVEEKDKRINELEKSEFALAKVKQILNKHIKTRLLESIIVRELIDLLLSNKGRGEHE